MRRNGVLSVALGLWAMGAGVFLVRCVGDDSNTNDAGKNDATTNDVANDVVQPPDAGFTLSLAPGHVTEDPGDNFPVTINVNRANGFSDPVTFVVTVPPGFTATQPAPAGTSSQFYIATNADAGAGDFDVTVTGSSTAIVQNVHLGVHVGSLLAIGDGGVVAVPQFATAVDVKMWGGGGGGSSGCQNSNFYTAQSGGGGGYTSARVPVTGGTYFAFVATGGGYTSNDCAPGGGGGGYSAFAAPDGGVMLVAGGGGGAANIDQYSGGYNGGGPGGAGGGVQGGSGGGTCVGFGGAPDGGGGVYCNGHAGGFLQGGNAPTANTPGGTPGGGAGGGSNPSYGTGSPGGGGGGYFGGGSGGMETGQCGTGVQSPCGSGGGGGGCGFNPYDGGVLTGADASAPPNVGDPDYVSGVAVGGSHAAGGPGRVVIRLPKP